MKKERILITLSLDFGLNEMGFESSLTRQEISIDNPELTGLSIREFCMLTKEQLLSAYGLTPEKVSAIERLLSEYSLRLGMTGAELDAYLDRYYKDNPREKEFYDLCDRMCGRALRRARLQGRVGQGAERQPAERQPAERKQAEWRPAERPGMATLPDRARGLSETALVHEMVRLPQEPDSEGRRGRHRHT